MTRSKKELLTRKQVRLIKKRCRKFRLRADQVDDCLQELALKFLQSNRNRSILKSKAIDNHIKSLLRKEMRYQACLVQLRVEFNEAIIYPLPLQIDVRLLIASMTDKQQKICILLAARLTHKQISRQLKTSPRTISREIAVIRELLSKYYS